MNARETIVEVEKIVLLEKRTIPHSVAKQKSYTVAEFDEGVEVYLEDQLIQRIDWNRKSLLQEYTRTEGYLITDMDVNFDGINDVGILQTVAYGGSNRFYDFYVWDTQSHHLVKDATLTNISNPSINYSTKTITMNMRGMPYNNWSYAELIYENGEYIKGRVWDVQAVEEEAFIQNTLTTHTEVPKSSEHPHSTSKLQTSKVTLTSTDIGTFSGTYVTYAKEAWEAKATCSGLKLEDNPDSQLQLYFTDLVKKGNTVQHFSSDGKLLLNLPWSEIPESDKERIVIATSSPITLSLQKKIQQGGEVGPCYSFFSYIGIQ